MIDPTAGWIIPIIAVLTLAFGVFLIIPIGGADMPTVIALLNAYAGLSAAGLGFVLDSKLLIVAGALDGASGLILVDHHVPRHEPLLPQRALRGLRRGGRRRRPAAAAQEQGQVRSADPSEAAELMKNARSVIIVPGYGMAVAQAQHKVRELSDALAKEGVEVRFAIHPVAGRMPGHMNVLLAEANVPYDQLLDMDEINGDFPQTDVVLVLGRQRRRQPRRPPRHVGSPIFGMPILEVDKAACVMVVKRSMRAGFAGIENELFFDPKTLMVFGDAKSVVTELSNEVSGANSATLALEVVDPMWVSRPRERG